MGNLDQIPPNLWNILSHDPYLISIDICEMLSSILRQHLNLPKDSLLKKTGNSRHI